MFLHLILLGQPNISFPKIFLRQGIRTVATFLLETNSLWHSSRISMFVSLLRLKSWVPLIAIGQIPCDCFTRLG